MNTFWIKLISGNTALKSVPVIIMLTMNPADVNSGVRSTYMPLNAQELTEVVALAQRNQVPTIDLRNIRPDQPITSKQVLPGIFRDENIQLKKSFKMEGKNYMLYFLDPVKNVRKDKDIVASIYMVPDDYSYIEKYGESMNYPPGLQKFIYHDFGDPENKDYCTAVLHERRCDKDGENSRFVDLEVRLPEEVANDLIDLINDDTDLVASKNIKEMFYIMKH